MHELGQRSFNCEHKTILKKIYLQGNTKGSMSQGKYNDNISIEANIKAM